MIQCDTCLAVTIAESKIKTEIAVTATVIAETVEIITISAVAASHTITKTGTKRLTVTVART